MTGPRDQAPSANEIRDTQIEPVAGIWICDNCGRRIQLITEGNKPKVGPFICACGTPMEPGEEHSQPVEPDKGTAIDG